MTLKLKLVTVETQWMLINERKFKIADQAWSSTIFPEIRDSYHSSTADMPNSTNVNGVKDPEIDRLVDEYEYCYDLKRRIEIIKQVDARLMELAPYALQWYSSFDRILYWNKFGHPDFYISRFADYQSIPTYWWFDPEKDAQLRDAMANDRTLPAGETDILYWNEHRQREKSQNDNTAGAGGTAGVNP